MVEAEGAVAALGIADGGDWATRAVDRIALVPGGLAGDFHAGVTRRACSRVPWHPRGTAIANTRQVSIIAEEELAEIAALMGVERIDPAWLGANIVTRGITALSALPPATRLLAPSGACLFVTEENLPCVEPGRRIAAALGHPELQPAFARAAIGRRGLVALVEREGAVATGDAMRVIRPAPRRLPRPLPVAPGLAASG